MFRIILTIIGVLIGASSVQASDPTGWATHEQPGDGSVQLPSDWTIVGLSEAVQASTAPPPRLPLSTIGSSAPTTEKVLLFTKDSDGSLRFRWDVFVFSLAMTWAIGLAPPLVIRVLILRRPMKHWWTAGPLVVALLVFNIILFTEMGSQSRHHPALMFVMFVSYYILRKGAGSKVRPADVIEPARGHRSEARAESSAGSDDDRFRGATERQLQRLQQIHETAKALKASRPSSRAP